MTTFGRSTGLSAALVCALAVPALAQTTAQPSGSAATQEAPAETRPATTTVTGDTGLWFVPTGEVLPARRWSFSLYRVNFYY